MGFGFRVEALGLDRSMDSSFCSSSGRASMQFCATHSFLPASE